MKLEYLDQKEVRNGMGKVIERAAWACRSMCYRSELLEVYAFEDVERLIDEMEDFKQLWLADRKSTRLNSSHVSESRMPSSA